MIIQENIPLADKNWFKTGGAARYFCQPKTEYDFQQALDFAQSHNLPLFVLGEGANIVVHDRGFDGLVINMLSDMPTYHSLTTETTAVTVSAGTTMHSLIEKTLDHNLIGLEVFSNIPGTIGGSVYINLHYFEAFLSDFLIQAKVIHKKTQEIVTVSKEWFDFGYDQSKLMHHEYFLLSATFKLKNGSSEEVAFARGRQFEITRHRQSRYPKDHTCGSFFRNFKDEEVHLLWEGKKMRFVAYYLDKIGVKGCLNVGNVWVSSQHANMLINKGNGTTADIIALARILQQKVFESFGIIPQPECIFVGFKEYPLL